MKDLKKYRTKIRSIKHLNTSVIEIKLEKPEGYTYKPGQFLQVIFSSGTEELSRSYSFCSTVEDDYLELCIKIIPGGKGSAYLSNLKAGDEIQISEPQGHFISDGHNADGKYFIATGVGIAPIIALLKYEISKNKAEKIKLLFGLRNEEDLFWVDLLKDLKTKTSNFEYDITLSQPSDDWKGLRGRVTNHLTMESNVHHYVCGSMPMVKDVRKILLDGGVNTKFIHLEIF